MLHKHILIATLLCCLLQPQSSFGQSSQELNNQGCDALVKHDYAEAEKLFIAAYQEAVKAHDSKHERTALDNLKDLYNGQGRDDKLQKLQQVMDGSAPSLPMSKEEFQKVRIFAKDLSSTLLDDVCKGKQKYVSWGVVTGTSVEKISDTKYEAIVPVRIVQRTFSETGTISLLVESRPSGLKAFASHVSLDEDHRSPENSERAGYSFTHTIRKLILKSNYSGQNYTGDVLALGESHKLDRSLCHIMMSVVEDGGAIIELNDGSVIEVAQDVDQNDWQLGDAVAVTEHPRLASPFVSLVKQDGQVLGGKVVATR